MQSLRSKIVIWLIKNRHLFKFKLKPEVVDNNFSVKDFRDEIDEISHKMNKLAKGVKVEETSVNDMYAEWIIPENALENKVLLYIHGGGFISGSCLTHRMHVSKFAAGSQVKTLLFDYRLAPEHPFPAAVDDCVAAYDWLLNHGYSHDQIIVGGESAGATLTLSLIHALKKDNTKLPKAAFSISPVTDLRCAKPSFSYNAKNDIAPMNSWTVWTNMYIGNNDVTDHLLSPQFGNFTGFPPLFICAGTHEIHLDDCLCLAQKAREAGVDVTLYKATGMIHAFPILAPMFPEATAAMKAICDFIKS